MENEKIKIIIERYFAVRKSKNSRYSYRAFSRDLGVPQSTLSSVLSGKLKVTTRVALQIGLRLKLTEPELLDLLISTLQVDETS